MPRFEVEVYQEWKETGFVFVDADDEDSAREIVDEMLATGDDTIEWQGSNMEPGQYGIEGIGNV